MNKMWGEERDQRESATFLSTLSRSKGMITDRTPFPHDHLGQLNSAQTAAEIKLATTIQ